MQARNLEFVVEQAGVQKGAFAKAVKDSIEVGVVVPSVFRAKLEAVGFEVVEDQASMSEYGFASMAVLQRTLVRKGDKLVAMGAAGDHDEALLHAALGYFRENAAPDADVPAGIAEAPTQP